MKVKSRKEILKEQKELKKIERLSSSDEETDIRKLFVIILVLVVGLIIVYFGTELLNKKEESDDTTSTTPEINYNVVSIGTMLNRSENEYYVLIYDSTGEDALLYSTLSTTKAKIYFCDLANSMNSVYYNVNNDNKSNPKATKIADLDLGDITLIKVKNGKISKYLEDYDKIKNELN